MQLMKVSFRCVRAYSVAPIKWTFKLVFNVRQKLALVTVVCICAGVEC